METGTLLSKKASDLSKLNYTKGLILAREGKLSIAENHLLAAIKADKSNISAQNLLGLVYYATGRISEAYLQWIISVKLDNEGNLAGEYLADFERNAQAAEKFSQAISLYNEALSYIRQSSEDLGVIRLKRAIELNPNMLDALNLLALIHIKNDEKQKAASLIEKVLSIDKSNSKARRYYELIYRSKPQNQEDRPGQAPSPAPKKSKTPPLAPYSAKKQHNFQMSYLAGVIPFLIGIATMFLFMFFIVMPANLSSANSEISELAYALSQQQAYTEQALEENAALYIRINSQAESFTAELNASFQAQDALQNENQLLRAHSYFVQEMHLESLTVLEQVSVDLLSGDLAALYANIREVSMPIALEHYFNEGHAQFLAGNFDQARTYLERAIVYITPDSELELAADIFYFLGQIAEEDGDIILAIAYYENIIQNFPGSNRVNSSTNRLNNLLP